MYCLSNKSNSNDNSNGDSDSGGSSLDLLNTTMAAPTTVKMKMEIKEEVFIEDHYVEVCDTIDCGENDNSSAQEDNIAVQDKCNFRLINLQSKNARKKKAESNPGISVLKNVTDVDDDQLHPSRINDNEFISGSLSFKNEKSESKVSGTHKANKNSFKKKKKFYQKQKSRKKTKNKSSSTKIIVKKRNLVDFDRKKRKELKCLVCSSVYNLTWGLVLHSSEAGHSNERQFKCSHCPKSYYSQEDLNSHQHLCIYSNIKCHWCKKVLIFRTISSYYKHIEVHRREKVLAKRKQIRRHNHIKSKQEYATRYKCVVCSSVFTRITDLHKHSDKEGHVNLPLLQCKHCSNKYYNLRDLNLHDRRQHQFYFRKCTVCNMEFTKHRSYEYHVRRGHRHKPNSQELSSRLKNNICRINGKYDCPHCKRSFTGRDSFIGHLNSHTGEKPYKCVECGTSFVSSRKLLRHKRGHSAKLEFKCSLCHSQFKSEIGLTLHMKMHNNGVEEKKLQCNSCDQMFSEQRDFIAHQIDNHNIPSPFTCKYCKIAFSYRKDLIDHLKKVHDKQSNAIRNCEFCGKLYNCEKKLLVHVLYHLEVSEEIIKQVMPRQRSHLKGSYQCEECGKVFNYMEGLKKHWKKIHAPDAADRKRICDICGKVTVDATALKRHKKTHEKTFVCEVCGKSYSKRQLEYHRKTHK